MPFHHTGDDVWQNIYEHSSKTVVMLDDLHGTVEVSWNIDMVLNIHDKYDWLYLIV